MSEDEVKKCPKCNGRMEKGKRLVSYTEISLANERQYVGDKIIPFCCKSCGYIELYRKAEKRL